MDMEMEDSDDDSFEDSIDEASMIDTNQVKKSDPFPDECPSEIIGITSLFTCLQNRYEICPKFFLGSLLEACQGAFNPIVLNERRPVLVYIHHDKSMFNNIFCLSIFCSEIIRDYLDNNYIVWPWDITFESNRNKLLGMWIDLFSIPPPSSFSIEKYPMLIGIMRQSVGEKNRISVCEYECKRLLEGDTITRTKEKSTPEVFLEELIVFKETCKKNEPVSSSEIIRKTNLCWEVVLEITKYLTLNDTINTFSVDILPFLRKYQSNCHLSSPPNTFINTVLEKIKSEKIVSLTLNTSLYRLETELASLTKLPHIISLKLLDFHLVDAINICEKYFPNLIQLSLWYQKEFDWNMLNNILKQLPRSIKRFELRCGSGLENYFSRTYSDMTFEPNQTIEYFLVDIHHSYGVFLGEHFQSNSFRALINFMKKMSQIRTIRLIINRYNLDEYLDEHQWKSLMRACSQLNKITVEIFDGLPEREQLQERAAELERILGENRATIRFQFVFV